MPSTLLLVRHPLDPGRLVTRPCRRVDRLLARLLAPTLDRRLAAGGPPESDRLLATRAQVLVAPDERRALAATWERLLQVVRSGPGRSPRGVTLCRQRIMEAEPAVRAMTAALTTALPLPARGVAMAVVLLRDGAGPLYNQDCPTDLIDAVREVAEALDPTASLAPSSWGRSA